MRTIQAGGITPKTSRRAGRAATASPITLRSANTERQRTTHQKDADQDQKIDGGVDDRAVGLERPVERLVEQPERHPRLDLERLRCVVGREGILERAVECQPDGRSDEDENARSEGSDTDKPAFLGDGPRLGNQHAKSGKIQEAEQQVSLLDGPAVHHAEVCAHERAQPEERAPRGSAFQDPKPEVKDPRRIGEAKDRGMVDAVDEEPDEFHGRGQEERRRQVPAQPPHAQPDPAREKPFRREVFEVPSPRGTVRQEGNKVEGVADAGLTLAEERCAPGVVAVPEAEAPRRAAANGARSSRAERWCQRTGSMSAPSALPSSVLWKPGT